MPRSTPQKPPKKPAQAKAKSRAKQAPKASRGSAGIVVRAGRRVKQAALVPIGKLRDLRTRRSHKTFSLSRRRDFVRQLQIPGYFAFTLQVGGMLLRNKRLFLSLSVVMSILVLILSGLSSHQLYSSFVESAMAEGDDTTTLVQVSALVVSTAGLLAGSGEGSEAQQVYLGIIGLITWLVTVWLLREVMAGQRPRLRDGLYNAGSPIVATAIVALLLLLQLIPVGLLALVYVALSTTGLISEGLGAFLFFGSAALVLTLTLYWITSTLLAMVIVTLPGMYPWRAMKAASDIVVGRRLRFLYRMLWMLVQAVSIWVIVITPSVALSLWLTNTFSWFKYVPLVTLVSTWLAMALIIWMAAYVYLLYRKVVASDASSSS